MNIIFIGGFFPEQMQSLILSKSKIQVQNAANAFQWAFIKGIEQNLDKPIKLLTAPFLGWFPKYYKDLIIKKSFFSNNGYQKSGITVGFLNLPLLKNIFKTFNLYAGLKTLISKQEKNVLIIYSLEKAYLKAAVAIKRKNPSTIICIIITDCYEFPSQSSIFRKLYSEHFDKPNLEKLLNKVDCFVVLTDKIIDLLKLHHKPWVRVEGLFDSKFSVPMNINKVECEKIVLYTGTLEYPYGIKQLLDAFKLIAAPDFRLWICGGGPGADLVRQRADEDFRIRYYGILSKEEVCNLQLRATILINPRNTVGEYNKYSFPSKTIEYFASGTPALLYKLDGIPDEYFDYCYTVDDNRIESLAESIIRTCELDPQVLKMTGDRAKDFILKNKDAKSQCGRVLKMIEDFANNAD